LDLFCFEELHKLCLMQGLKNKKRTPERSFLFLSQNDITGTRRKAIPFEIQSLS